MPYTIDVVIKERADLAARLVVVERERDAAREQARLAWERHAEKDRAYGTALRERDGAKQLLDKATDLCAKQGCEISQLRADNARLREALEEIGVIANTAYKYSNDTRCTAHCLSIMEQARAALAQTGGAS